MWTRASLQGKLQGHHAQVATLPLAPRRGGLPCSALVAKFKQGCLAQRPTVGVVKAWAPDQEEVQGAQQLMSVAATLVPVEFVLRREVHFGQSHTIVGSHPSLGSWDIMAAPEMVWEEGHVWRAKVSLPAGADVDLKCVCLTGGKRGLAVWEQGPNHTVHIPISAAGAASLAVEISWGSHVEVVVQPAPEGQGEAEVEQAALQARSPAQEVLAGVNGAAPAAAAVLEIAALAAGEAGAVPANAPPLPSESKPDVLAAQAAPERDGEAASLARLELREALATSASLAQQNSKLSQELTALREEVGQLRAALSAKEVEAADSKLALLHKAGELAEAQEALSREREAAQRLSDEAARAAGQLQAALSSSSSLAQQNAGLSRAVEVLRAEVEELQGELAGRDAALVAARAQLTETRRELQSWQDGNPDHSGMQAQLQDARHSLMQANDTVQALRAEVHTLIALAGLPPFTGGGAGGDGLGNGARTEPERRW